MIASFYPPSPANTHKKLTSLTPSYQFKAFLAILSILLFFVLYAALVVSLGFLVYYAVIYDMGGVNKLTILMKAGAIAGAVMLFAFTLKFIFKLKNNKPANRIKLEKGDHPDLWAFIEQICKETGAPKPRHIYVDPDVNAYVSYSNMWLSLFLPVRKDLTIGMGLVDCLNLSEFKAVISHEFGHFAQRSMKIGSYIISANTVIHGMIYSRDKWDDLLDQWRGSDIRLSAAAWIITPIIWIIRQVLALFYQFLNIMYSQLSREMEFNADKVAVSTSGSDAIISALWKLDNGVAKWNGTVNSAYLASQKENFVKNLYHHNALAISRDSENQQDLITNLPSDPRGGKQYFSTSDVSKVSMYASHPPNDKREDNAKFPYVHCEEDARTPWILFGEKDRVQEDMTTLIYEQYINKQPKDFVTTEIFEAFIQAETADEALSKEYADTFKNRFVEIPEKVVLASEAKKLGIPDKTVFDKLKNELKVLMQPINELEELMLKAQQIAEGTSKEKAFSVHGLTYNKKNLQQGYEYLVNQREKLYNETFTAWDSSFFSLHYALADKEGQTQKLLKYYGQHRVLVNFYKTISNTKAKIYQKVNDARAQGEITHGMINALQHSIKQSVAALNEDIRNLADHDFVPLPNIETVDELQKAIVDGGSFQLETGNIFENGGFNRIANTLENALVHCQRVEQKSIGMLLKFHKELQEKANIS